MAKKNLNEPCIFCNAAPCECAGAVKVKKKPAVKSRPPVTPPREPEKEDIYGAVPSSVTKFKTPAKEIDVDLSRLSALRVLREIVCEQDRQMIDKELNRPYPQELDRRLTEWRDNHGLSE